MDGPTDHISWFLNKTPQLRTLTVGEHGKITGIASMSAVLRF